MKKEVYKFPKSAFLSVDKDISTIAERIIQNNNLKKLLFYTSQDALEKENLTEDQTIELFKKNISIVPRKPIDPDVRNYIIINFDNFFPSKNPEYRNNLIEFDILCHFDQWLLNDSKLRPYRIAAEIDTMFNDQKLSGIGTLQFANCSQIIMNEELGGLCLAYLATHDGDDSKNPNNPTDIENLIANFNEIFNTNQEDENE